MGLVVEYLGANTILADVAANARSCCRSGTHSHSLSPSVLLLAVDLAADICAIGSISVKDTAYADAISHPLLLSGLCGDGGCVRRRGGHWCSAMDRLPAFESLM